MKGKPKVSWKPEEIKEQKTQEGKIKHKKNYLPLNNKYM